MQGVEKHNDVLSRLYFSSTNPAKNPLLTMLQKLCRMLEMNFQNEKERNAMAKFANTGVYDFVEDLSENESNAEDNTFSSNSQENDAESEDENGEIVDPSTRESEEKYIDEESISKETLVWAPKKKILYHCCTSNRK